MNPQILKVIMKYGHQKIINTKIAFLDKDFPILEENRNHNVLILNQLIHINIMKNVLALMKILSILFIKIIFFFIK